MHRSRILKFTDLRLRLREGAAPALPFVIAWLMRR
jgi:hypothetical protein